MKKEESKPTKKPGTAIVDAAAIRAQLAKESEGLGSRIQAAGGDKIKLTKKKTFKTPDGQESEGPLSVVILDFISVNKFFDRPYKDGEISPPACFAIGPEPAALVPSPNSPDKQNDSCAKCPNNEFGSKGNGKACGNHRVLVVRAGVGDEGANPDAPKMILEVSPTSIKAFDAYVQMVRTQFQTPPVGVVTDIFFDPSVDYQSLRFGNPQPNENLDLHFQERAAAAARLLIEPDVSKYEKPGKKAKK